MEKSTVQNAVSTVEANGPLKTAMAVYTAVGKILDCSPQYVGALIKKYEIVMQTKPAGKGRPVGSKKNTEVVSTNSQPSEMLLNILEKLVASIPDEHQTLADLLQEHFVPGITGTSVSNHILNMIENDSNRALVEILREEPSETEVVRVA
jgi:hypothetical protein